jgi:hypothetical protein
MLPSLSLTPSASAGKTSQIRLMYRICSGKRSSGAFSSATIDTAKISPALPDSMYMMKRRMLPKMARPCAIAATPVAKLSSFSTMSAASRATWVPRCPMAMPMSAFLSAGASLTPSPVIATREPARWWMSIRSSFCAGSTRAKIGVSSSIRRGSSLGCPAVWSSRPTITRASSGSSISPTAAAMLRAVAG